MTELIAGLREPKESAEARLPVLTNEFAPLTEKVLEKVEEQFRELDGFSIVPNNYEGVRVNADREHGDGWFLIRRSLHDPLMPTNIESDSEGGLKMIASALLELLNRFPELDVSSLEKLAE